MKVNHIEKEDSEDKPETYDVNEKPASINPPEESLFFLNSRSRSLKSHKSLPIETDKNEPKFIRSFSIV